MSSEERRSDWSMIVAIALIVFGLLALLNQFGGPGWSEFRHLMNDTVGRAIWPLALIGLGVFVLVGARRGAFAQVNTAGRRLYRSRTDRMVSGVLAGFGDWIGWDPTWVRIGFALLTISTGFWTGVVVYIIGSILIPEEPVGGANDVRRGTPPTPPEPPAWARPEPGSTETVQQPPAPPSPPRS